MSKKTNIIVVAYPDRGVGNDPKLFSFFFFFFFFGGGGEGGGVVFHHQGSTFSQWAYGSNDLPRPRRSALSECFCQEVMFW